ncbi:hypothetical protein SLINC_6720 [Streptomyces lincolnensis]|uniref:Uncharacterized protein n=1 Tax=Streptomyces lincolnensis TaxID=1915 RepID=A0A1B1MK40_STRLN|nr:hypothetical protein [Streptomyces lincolnensis]ANS68944.1 hypothetical protein SLINC_6720 [Streptomyces lincolnensis]AXG52850.1 hypothetical protein SLCG_1695 [Streptomyces lincolnensis]
MSQNAEHARQPQPGSPDPSAPRNPQAPQSQRTPQAPVTNPAHDPREPATNAANGGRSSPDRKPTPEMLPQGERDKLTLRLQQALNTFVDSPRQAVEEADSVFDEVATHFTNTLTEQRRVLRSGWQSQDTEAQTEELRVALRQYREITERLLHMAAPADR